MTDDAAAAAITALRAHEARRRAPAGQAAQATSSALRDAGGAAIAVVKPDAGAAARATVSLASEVRSSSPSSPAQPASCPMGGAAAVMPPR